MNDGNLQKQYEAYRERLTFIENIGRDEGCTKEMIQEQLEKMLGYITDDLKSIHSSKLNHNMFICNGMVCT